MQNYVRDGDTLNYTPTSAVSSGDFVVIGVIGAVALSDIAANATGAARITGVVTMPKATGAITQGAKLYWSAANSNLTTTATSNTLVGVAAAAAASGAATAQLLLNVAL